MADQHHDIREQLSSLMDGEASELEFARLLRAADSNEELRAVWSRYQLVSGLLRQQDVYPAAGLLVPDRVAAALQREKVMLPASSSWRRPLVNLAVAASVALMVVTTVQWRQSNKESTNVIAAAGAQAEAVGKSEPSPFTAQPLIEKNAMAAPALLASQTLTDAQLKARQSEQVQRYMQNRIEPGSAEASRGKVPMAPLAVHESK